VTTDLFESAGVGICVVDADGRIETANDSLRRMLGLPPGTVERRPLLDFVRADAHAGVTALLARTGRGEAAQADVPLLAADGSLRWVLASTSLLPGAAPRVAMIAVDVTERRRAEEQLRHSEAQYRVLAETAEDHIFVINRDDDVEYVNQAAARQLRTSPDRLIGRKRTEIFPPEVAERQGQSLRRVFETGQPFYAEGRTLYLEREVWLGTWLVPVPDSNGGITAVLGLSRDMTEQRRAQSETSHAQKLEAIGRLAGGIAHDFNNNLSAILGYVEVMLQDVAPESALGQHLKEVQHAGQRASGLVRRLLAFGRRQVLQPRDLRLNAVIEGLTPMLQQLIGPRIRIETSLAPDLRLVTADPGEIEQVVMNLALNARDAMPGGGTLTIETVNVAEPLAVRMTIRDTGAGMDDHVKAHVFEPFFTTKPSGEGTGLGLSTVYGIVTQLRGAVSVESEPGRGAAFHVRLPVAVGGGAPETGSAPPPAQAAVPTRESILLVEDEDSVRRFARLALERHGYHVVDAATPEEALAMATSGKQRFGLLLTDVVMPRMSGPELAEHLGELLPGLIVLYMSGYPSAVLDDGAPTTGLRLIAKPFTLAELIAGVDAALGAAGSRA
jgi:PAS domain S-box-containing protein